MTKKFSRAPMELDLDSFLQLQSSSDEDEDLESFPHRTIDEILNDSDSSSSSSNTHSFSSSLNLTDIQAKPDKSDNSLSIEKSLFQDKLKSPEAPKLEEKVMESQIDSFSSRNSNELLRNPYLLGRSTSRPFPQLFGGRVRVNPKPGAALAAAAAASRSITTRHAAAIKSRRTNSDANLQRTLHSEELDSLVGDSEITSVASSGDALTSFEPEITQLDSKVGEHDERVKIIQSESRELVDGKHVNDKNLVREDVPELSFDNMEVSPVKETLEEHTKDTKLDEIELGRDEDPILTKEMVSTKIIETDDNRNVDEGYREMSSNDLGDATGTAHEFNLNSTSSTSLPENTILPSNEVNNSLEEESLLIGSEIPDSEKSIAAAAENGEVNFAVDETASISESGEVVEDRAVESNAKKGGKKSGKKSLSSMKPLELAEDLEKKHAYSGLHWEEGAAAQPMRLEGIRRGPPAVGYLDIDANNAITRTISSATFRREHGSPQVLAVHANFIAVGLSKGLTLVVPSKYSAQNADNMDAKMLMLAPQVERFHSPVTSMCFNQQGDLLLAGYGNGHVILWDVQRAATTKVITGEHAAPVVHTLFLGQDAQMTRQFKAVTGDCKGLVLLHSFSVVPLLNRFSVNTKCLLDGQNTGIVLTASPLLMEDSGKFTTAPGNSTISSSGIGSMMGGVVGGSLFNESSSLVDEGVVIFVTHQTALVVQLTPKMKVYAHLSKPDGVRDGAMPHTAWKCAPLSQSSSPESVGGETSDRASMLVIAWDRKVQVAKLVETELKVYREWTLDSAAIGVAWLDEQMLVILTSRRQFCLFSKEGNELHRTSFPVDLSGADDFIGYHTYFSNLFGNPEKSYNNCLAVRGATIYVLGPRHLVVSRLLPWKERIQVLQKAGDWMGALDMAMRLYDGQAHGVIDLPRTLDAIRRAIMSYLVELILSYVDEVFSYISVAFSNQIEKEEQGQNPESLRSSAHSELGDQFARVGGVAVEFCVHIKRVDILFDDIFSKFVAVHHGGTFLELLEPYILKDMLGCLPPEIMQALVEHYSSKGWLQRVEQCVLHMDISSLDFNQVVRLCREHGLYGALIYLFNRGLDDFKAPLEELLLVLQNSQSENAANIGYRMLVYLKYCFSGLAFPPGHGILQPTRLPSLRRELLEFLLEDSSEKNSEVVVSFKLRAGVFPNLFHLLQIDTEATLEVLKLAFTEVSNSDHKPKTENLDDEIENGKNTEALYLMVQGTVNSLVPILDPGIAIEDGIWPSKKDMGHLLEFIAYVVACGRATVAKSILNRILEFLTSENIFSLLSQKIDTTKTIEKQMLTILRVVPETDWNFSCVLDLCEKAHYYQVCGYIHTKEHQYVAALDSYMKDLDEPIHAFSFINNMLLHLRDAEFVTFRTAVISKISELLKLSREGAFFLIFDHFNKESEYILSELRSSPKSLFLYLKATIEVHLSGTLNFSSMVKGYNMDPQKANNMKDHSNEIVLYLERLSEFPKLVRQNPVQITDDLIELYVEFLCQFERNSVLKFLQTFENYRVERCLRLCQDYKVIDAAAFLLERVGDVGSALQHTLSVLSEKFRMLDSAVQNAFSSSCSSDSGTQLFNTVSRMEEVSAVRDILHSSIGICQRNSKRLDPEESESLWFQLLDSFCEPLRDPNDGESVSRGHISGTLATRFDDKELLVDYWRIPKSHKGAQILRKLFAQFIKEIVEGMIGGYVHLPTIMSKLLSDNGTQVFGDFKLIILGMLGSYGFEKRILDTAKSLIEEDTYHTMSVLKKGASHGYAPQSLVCQICGCVFSKESSTSGIRVFNCGHATHVSCEIQENGSGCPICVPKKKTGVLRKNKSLTDNSLVQNSTQHTQSTNNTAQHMHESDLAGVQQISRFEILSNLKKTQRSFQIESLPQLRLAPPAVYHEKIQKKTNGLAGESSNNVGVKSEKSGRQTMDLKMKKPPLRFPLKSSIFGKEVTRKR